MNEELEEALTKVSCAKMELERYSKTEENKKHAEYLRLLSFDMDSVTSLLESYQALVRSLRTALR